MLKFKLMVDKDKETEWLNEMAQKGYAATGFFAGFYKFEQCMPGEYTYQIDITPEFFRVSEDYREFMAETGAEVVICWGYWVILRKKTSEGEFQLYTDTESTIEHYKKIRKMFKIVTIIEILCFMVNVYGAMDMNKTALVGTAVLGLIIIACMRITFKTNKIIGELEKQTAAGTSSQVRATNGLIVSGMLINLGALAVGDVVSEGIVMGLQIGAIVLMLVGIYRLARDNWGRK